MLLLLLACGALRTGPVSPPEPGLHTVEAGVDARGEARIAQIVVPDGRIRGAIWVFHGGRDTTAAQIMGPWRGREDDGWLLVFPEGQRREPTQGAWYTEDDEPLHVDVIARLHDQISERYGVVRHLATGFSSGAHMTWQLACHAPDRFDAFVPVSHYLLEATAARCAPDPVRPLLLIGSVDDPRAPYGGRAAPDGSPHNLGARASLERWSALAGCHGKATVRPFPKGEQRSWPGCGLEHIQLQGVGHTWPDRPDVTGMVVDFFERRVPAVGRP